MSERGRKSLRPEVAARAIFLRLSVAGTDGAMSDRLTDVALPEPGSRGSRREVR